MEPSFFSFTVTRELPVEGNFAVSKSEITPDGHFLLLTLTPISPEARRRFEFLNTEIDLSEHYIATITGFDKEGYEYSDIDLSSRDTEYILSLIPPELRGGG